MAGTSQISVRGSRRSNVAAGRAALFEVTLVVFLGAPKRARRSNFRGHGATQLGARFDGLLGLFRCGFLLGRVKKDRGPILRALIGHLSIHLSRVVNRPENVEQLIVAEFLRVKSDLYDFGMAGRIRTNILIAGVFRATDRKSTRLNSSHT